VAFIGALAYIAAISRLPITYAYPLASLSFPAVLLGGWLLFGEALTWPKALGSALIVLGVALSAASR
ncbi:MAG: EamA family transporter, partial [Alphaproteobacteria bacterium]|nr:EamA family transporter [Alphaproteobacteria bacterium]